MRLRVRVECGKGDVQGRDSRSHASLHTSTTTLRPVTLGRRLISMTRRNLAIIRVGRAFNGLISQETARANACEASADLRTRRHEREEVDAYLGALHLQIVDNA